MYLQHFGKALSIPDSLLHLNKLMLIYFSLPVFIGKQVESEIH
jgi:hypothetical protein